MPYSTSICDFGKSVIPGRAIVVTLIQLHTNLEGKSGQREITGGPERNSGEYNDYVMELVREALNEKQSDLVVLPELSTSVELEKSICKEVQQNKRNIIVVGGSYDYQQRNRVPIICWIDGKERKFYQEKCLPTPKETQNGLLPGDTRFIFVNTGFGDFAVQVCYEVTSAQEFQFLQNFVDFVVVVARNNARKTFADEFRRVCRKHYFAIAYANYVNLYASNARAQGGETAFYMPFRNSDICCQELILGKQEGISTYKLDVRRLDDGRQGKDIDNPADDALSTPQGDIEQKSRYTPEKRTKFYFEELVRAKERHSLPHDVIAYVEKYEEGEAKYRSAILSTPYIIGISQRADLVLPMEMGADGVIKRHIILHWKNEGFELEVRGKTYIFDRSRNPKRVENFYPILKDGDYFRLAKKFLFRLRFFYSRIKSSSVYFNINRDSSEIGELPPEE